MYQKEHKVPFIFAFEYQTHELASNPKTKHYRFIKNHQSIMQRNLLSVCQKQLHHEQIFAKLVLL
jgi:hypothetical protein